MATDQHPDNTSNNGCIVGLIRLAIAIPVLLAILLGINWLATNGTTIVENFRNNTPEGIDQLSAKPRVSTPQPIPTNIDDMTNADWLRQRHRDTYNAVKNLA